MKNQSGGNIDDLIDVQIKIVKDSLKKMRQNRPVDEKDTIEQLVRNRNAYKQYLKNYLNDYEQKQVRQSEAKSR